MALGRSHWQGVWARDFGMHFLFDICFILGEGYLQHWRRSMVTLAFIS